MRGIPDRLSNVIVCERFTSRRYIKTKPGRNLMSVSNPTLITFVIYIAAMVLIGFMAYRSTNNLSDYILGGRSLGSVVTALSRAHPT
jgi:sodium/proline symporter